MGSPLEFSWDPEHLKRFHAPVRKTWLRIKSVFAGPPHVLWPWMLGQAAFIASAPEIVQGTRLGLADKVRDSPIAQYRVLGGSS